MKKIIYFLCFLFVFVLALVIPSVTTKAYSVSDFGVDSYTTFDDFYTDINGYYLDFKLRGHYTINNHIEFFVCYGSTSDDKLVLSTSYKFTDYTSYEFIDDHCDIYDIELEGLVLFINNYLLNLNRGYSTLISDSVYYVTNNYVGCVGYIEGGSIIGLVRGGYEGSLISEPYVSFLNNFGALNTTYVYRDLVDSIYNYYGGVLDGIDAYYQDLIDEADSDGYDRGYADGLISDDNDAYEQGKRVGYTEAIEEGQQVTGFIFGLWDTFMNGIRSMFNVDIFGINLSSIIFFILSLGIISYVLRRLF